MVLKKTPELLAFSIFGGCGGLARTDFQRFLL